MQTVCTWLVNMRQCQDPKNNSFIVLNKLHPIIGGFSHPIPYMKASNSLESTKTAIKKYIYKI